MKKTGLFCLAMALFGLIFTMGTPEAVRAGTISYTYDDAGRLIKADYGGDKSITYTYDNNGNLLQRTVQDASTGSLQVTIEPEGARTAGAQWRRTGTSAWFDSGATETGLAPGDYTVEFKAVTGWTAPSNQNVTVTAGQTTQSTGTYTQTPTTYTLTVGVSPEAGGTVAKNPDKAEYDAGETVQVTATANTGYVFTGWSGDLSGTANPANVTMDGNKTITANFTTSQTLATGKASSFKATVTKIEMFNGSAWVLLFSGTAQLDMVNGGVFPGAANRVLPQGTYSKIRVTFKNNFPVTGTLSCGGAAYYTTADTFRGQTNLASVPTTVAVNMAAYTFRMATWGALNADVIQQFNIAPVTVSADTHYQPTLRFTLSDQFRLMGTQGSPDTYYFEHAGPGVSIVE